MSKNEIFCPLECGLKILDLEKHLQKCKRKKLLGSEYLQCPYNKKHIFKKSVFHHHVHDCPENKKVETVKRHMSMVVSNNSVQNSLKKFQEIYFAIHGKDNEKEIKSSKNIPIIEDVPSREDSSEENDNNK